MAVVIVHGAEGEHLPVLRRLAKSGRQELWTAPKAAAPGDLAAFYMLAPTMAIVAVGKVMSNTEDGEPHGWPGKYMADIGDITLLDSWVTREQLLAKFPEWGYWKAPRKPYSVPLARQAGFLDMLATIPELHEVIEPSRLEEPQSDTAGTSAKPRRGSGFVADQVLKKAIEDHAMVAAQGFYEGQGFVVADVSLVESFDLLATGVGADRRIEVKGSSGVADAVSVTKNEVSSARTNPDTDLVVVDRIEWTRGEAGEIITYGGRLRLWQPWSPSDSSLTPTQFRHDLDQPPSVQDDIVY